MTCKPLKPLRVPSAVLTYLFTVDTERLEVRHNIQIKLVAVLVAVAALPQGPVSVRGLPVRASTITASPHPHT